MELATTRPTVMIAMADDVPITRYPFVMAHDAASGYLPVDGVNRWVKTQRVGVVGQLECGARAFDMRPMLRGKTLAWHHGDVPIDYPLENTLADVSEWLRSHPDELVLLNVWDCVPAPACMTAVRASLAAAGIHEIADCARLRNMTVSAARRRGGLPTGGSVLAITGPAAATDGAACSYGNYDRTIACSGYHRERQTAASLFGCWSTDATRKYPIDRMLQMLDAVARGGLRDGFFTQAQALWQETDASVAIGVLRNSSLLLDERRSALNALLAGEARAKGRWRRSVNLFEVNDVCDGGRELARALLLRSDAS